MMWLPSAIYPFLIDLELADLKLADPESLF